MTPFGQASGRDTAAIARELDAYNAAAAAECAARGVTFVDAPVSGGPPLAATGQLTVMCGGTDADVARAA